MRPNLYNRKSNRNWLKSCKKIKSGEDIASLYKPNYIGLNKIQSINANERQMYNIFSNSEEFSKYSLAIDGQDKVVYLERVKLFHFQFHLKYKQKKYILNIKNSNNTITLDEIIGRIQRKIRSKISFMTHIFEMFDQDFNQWTEIGVINQLLPKIAKIRVSIKDFDNFKCFVRICENKFEKFDFNLKITKCYNDSQKYYVIMDILRKVFKSSFTNGDSFQIFNMKSKKYINLIPFQSIIPNGSQIRVHRFMLCSIKVQIFPMENQLSNKKKLDKNKRCLQATVEYLDNKHTIFINTSNNQLNLKKLIEKIQTTLEANINVNRYSFEFFDGNRIGFHISNDNQFLVCMTNISRTPKQETKQKKKKIITNKPLKVSHRKWKNFKWV